MKILFFTCGLGPGGKERRLMELMKELKNHPEIEFELVLMSTDIHYKEVLDLDIKIHYLIRNTKKDLTAFYKFYKICKSFNPDIVHCWDSMTAVYSAFTCKLLRIKLINGMITDAQKPGSLFSSNKIRSIITFPLSDIIVSNSQAGVYAYAAPRLKSRVIFNGFNFNRTLNLIPQEQVRNDLNITTRFVVGMVASFSVYKDYKTYYESAQILLDRGHDITFLAIGNETDSFQSRSLIKDEFIRDFRLLGKKSGVESLINVMDVCVLATYTEGISNSIMEYMAMAKPVVATDGGGTKELVIQNETGFLVQPSTPLEIGNCVEQLLNNQALRHKMGMSGQKRIHEVFSIESMIHNFMNLYFSLVKKR